MECRRPAISHQPLPSAQQLQVGQQYNWNGERYTLSVITNAAYRGVQGLQEYFVTGEHHEFDNFAREAEPQRIERAAFFVGS